MAHTHRCRFSYHCRFYSPAARQETWWSTRSWAQASSLIEEALMVGMEVYLKVLDSEGKRLKHVFRPGESVPSTVRELLSL